LLIQGAIDADVPVGSEIRISFYAAPVEVASGGSGFPQAFGSALVVKRKDGASSFSTVVDASLRADQSVFAKAEGPFQTEARLSKLHEIRQGVDADQDGVDEEIESLGRGKGDANRDGAPDKHQRSVTSFPASNGEFLTLDAHGHRLRNVKAAHARSARSTHAEAPLGLVSFEVAALTPGQAITVDLHLTDDADVNAA
jgi:hypothetical protein